MKRWQPAYSDLPTKRPLEWVLLYDVKIVAFSDYYL